VSAKTRNKKASVEQAPGIATFWLDRAAVFAFGDGRLVVDGKTHRPHSGGIVSATLSPSGEQALTASDDGQILATDHLGQTQTIFEKSGAWLDHLVAHKNSHCLAFICGRDIVRIDTQNPARIQTYRPLRAPNSLAFSGDGDLLAIGHSGGVSLFRTDTPEEAWFEFPCGGGPVSVALSPNGGFLFAGLSEPALAGWRLADGQGFRMGGYPGKPRQLVWNPTGTALLTSGGPALLVWPMVGPDGHTMQGPMGQAAGVYRTRLGLVSAVASHGNAAAIGWSDGGVDVVALDTGEARHVGGPKPPATLNQDPRALTKAIIATSFRADGGQVSWISETGQYGNAATGLGFS
jgi:WD40 repeat protein